MASNSINVKVNLTFDPSYLKMIETMAELEKATITNLLVDYCDYCHGTTRNDSRGNCSACGAPR
jgi:hypothetical protein